MPHGILFVGYIVLAIILRKKLNWSFKTFVLISLASVTPFGTFYVDKKYLSN
jgi:integral membrane protein